MNSSAEQVESEDHNDNDDDPKKIVKDRRKYFAVDEFIRRIGRVKSKGIIAMKIIPKISSA